jgi:hypothetical protein
MPGKMAEPIRLTKGVHAQDIRSALTPGRTNRVFAVLDGPPLKVLTKYPLEVLELGGHLPNGWDGGYFPSERRITILPSVSSEHYGRPFVPGSIQFVTNAAKSETAAIQRNLVHEIGHLLLDRESRVLKSYVRAAFHRNRDAAVSRYGRRNSREFFAESWAAYIFERKALRGYSQEVYSMVEHVLNEAGLL